MAENDSVYKKNYHLKWSTLLGQPVSYYDVILAFIYYFIFLHFSFRLRAHKAGTGDDHSWPDPASFAATQTPGNDFNISLFYFTTYSSLILQFLLFQYVCLWMLARESIKLFQHPSFSLAFRIFYRLQDFSS